jgi:hypothetical protein
MATPTTTILSDKKGDFQLFPNPAEDIIHIKGSNFTYLEIIDLNGQVVFSTTQPIQTIQTQHLSNGIYIVRIIANQQTYQQKIIINHVE